MPEISREAKIIKVEATYNLTGFTSKEISDLREIFYKVAYLGGLSRNTNVNALLEYANFAYDMMELCDKYLQEWMSEQEN